MHSAGKVRCVVVTPEKTIFDREASMVVVPSFDGEIGVMPGHAAAVARLGSGELRLTGAAEGSTSYFIEGGFVQIKDNVVTVMTPKVRERSELDVARLEAQFNELSAQTSTSTAGQQARTERLNGIRSALRLARRR